MPLGARVGSTIGGEEPIMDLTAAFAFPAFLWGFDPDPPHTASWQVGLDARAYFQL
jgi:hypothetical protein